MRVVVLANTELGSWRARHRGVLDRIAHTFGQTPLEFKIEQIPAHQLQEAAARAAESAPDAIVAAGGDGTISSVAAALVGTPVALGVIPLGTFNHFARDIGISLRLESAIQTIAAGCVRRVDIGEVNSHTFINNASIGAYPVMVVDRDRQQMRFGRSKWRAMLRAGWRVLRRFPLMEVRLKLKPDAPWCTTPCVFVGNNRYRFDLLAPGTRPALDRGRLSVYAMRATSRSAVLRLGLKAALGRLADDDSLLSTEVEEFWVECRRPRVHVGRDGEVLRLTAPLHFRIRPRALRVIVPATHGEDKDKDD